MQSIVVLHKRKTLFSIIVHMQKRPKKCQCNIYSDRHIFFHCMRIYLAFILFDFRIHNKRYALSFESGIRNGIYESTKIQVCIMYNVAYCLHENMFFFISINWTTIDVWLKLSNKQISCIKMMNINTFYLEGYSTLEIFTH